MRETLDKLLQKLAVSHVMAPYETQPWVHYDEDRGLTCSAEVRMGSAGKDVEAEIQLLSDEETENAGDADESGAGGCNQILWMRAEPVSEGQWAPIMLRVQKKDYKNAFHNWEEKGCEFFRSSVEALVMGEIPDFEQLAGKHMIDDSGGARGGSGRIGRKSPKATNAVASMGMKK